MSGGTGEFELIARHFAPLASPEGLALGDDAALVPPPAGEALAVTCDTMVSGIHFLPSDPPDSIGHKLLAVNLSDLAAMGARPFGYLLASAWPLDIEEDWIAAFAQGLAADQEAFEVALYGGDTTATTGPMTLSLTAFGAVRGDRVLDRGSLQPGDDLYVTGTIGEGWLGLLALRGELEGLAPAEREALIGRYRLPQPRLAVGQALLAEGIARSALDVSDGLAGDVRHLLEASGVGAEIELAAVPASPVAEAALARLGRPRQDLLTGGDDYELAFAAHPDRREAVAALARRTGLPIARIGRVVAGAGLSVRDAAGAEVALEKAGWTHF